VAVNEWLSEKSEQLGLIGGGQLRGSGSEGMDRLCKWLEEDNNDGLVVHLG
jgi:hypothetical protein